MHIKFLRKIKWAYQRATRGYADRDLWSFDWYLCEMIPKALKDLQDQNHGIPCEFLYDEDNNELEGGKKRWNATIQQMIEGFEAHLRILDMDYESEIGPHPATQKSFPIIITPESREYIRKMNELMERDEQVFLKGMEVFAKYFGSLWT